MHSTLPHRLAIVILCVIGGWIISSAYFVNIETVDGYEVVANVRYFLGQVDQYFIDRGPLGSLLLIPAQWVTASLQLPAFDVRVYHLFYGLLHIIYIWLVYELLHRYHTDEVAILIAFLATIPSFIFFSYAPFLNVDIYPGVIFLAMLLLAHRFSLQPSWHTWALLTTLGTIAPLIKHTYALFWIISIIACGIPLLLSRKYLQLCWMLSGAVVSAVIAWLVLAAVLLGQIRIVGANGMQQHVPTLLLPYYQILLIMSSNAPEITDNTHWWFYYRNFVPGYGALATILIITGLIFAIRGKDPLAKRIALAWLLAVVIMTITPLRETRYLAFLAPLTAFLVVTPIQIVLQQRRRWLPIMVLLLLVDLSLSTVEAARIYGDFFTSNPVINFLRVIDDTSSYKRPILMTAWPSFASQVYSPLVGDRYHKLFHLSPDAIGRLYKRPSATLTIDFLDTPEKLAILQHPDRLPDKTVLLQANTVLVRKIDVQEHYLPQEQQDHTEIAAFSNHAVYRRVGNIYICDDTNFSAMPLVIIRQNKDTQQPSIIPLGKSITTDLLTTLGYIPATTVDVWGFRVTALCKIDKCKFFSQQH